MGKRIERMIDQKEELHAKYYKVSIFRLFGDSDSGIYVWGCIRNCLVSTVFIKISVYR